MTADYTKIGPLVKSIAQTRQLLPAKSHQIDDKTDNVVRIDFQQRQGPAEVSLSASKGSNVDSANNEARDTPKETLNELNSSTQVVSRNLEFHIDDDSGKTVITVRDANSQKVIRQIPSDQLLEISSKLKALQESNADTSSAKGILFTSKT